MRKKTDLSDSEIEFNIFKMLRVIRNISVKELSEELNVTPAYIRAIENGERQPSDKLKKEYMRVLRVNEEVFTTFNTNERRHDSFEKLLRYLLGLVIRMDDNELNDKTEYGDE